MSGLSSLLGSGLFLPDAMMVGWLDGWMVGWLGGWVVGWLGGWVVSGLLVATLSLTL